MKCISCSPQILVWREWATIGLDMITPEQTEEIISRVVAKIFRRFHVSTNEHQPLASGHDN